MNMKMRTMTQSQEESLRALWSTNSSIRDLMNMYGCSQQVIYRWIKELGLPDKRLKTGSRNPSWKGGRLIKSGHQYVEVYVDENSPFISMAHRRDHTRNKAGYIPEHRLVMAEHLNRPLTSSEQVHHLNGDQTDNCIENLQLRNTHHGSGQCWRCQDCGSINVVAQEI